MRANNPNNPVQNLTIKAEFTSATKIKVTAVFDEFDDPTGILEVNHVQYYQYGTTLVWEIDIITGKTKWITAFPSGTYYDQKGNPVAFQFIETQETYRRLLAGEYFVAARR